MAASITRVNLSEGWKFRLADSNGEEEAERRSVLKQWNDATQVPSVIHSELISADIIEDYRLGDNDRKLQWVGRADWEYACSFSTPKGDAQNIDLVFEGLDTIAVVTLNGKEILSSENQFVTHRVPVKDTLRRVGDENELSIVFKSVAKVGKELEEKYGKRTSLMRDPVRCHFRKSGYHWGWDWGPIVVTSGPWKPIFLEAYDNRIEDVQIDVDLSSDHRSATIAVTVTTDTRDRESGSNRFEVHCFNAAGVEVASDKGPIESKNESAKLKIQDPELWWPNGQGEQHLYTIQVSVISKDSNEIVDTRTIKRGIRSISLVQRSLDDEPGTSFMFNVNGRDIFSQGACWIPADNLLPSISRERYFDWIRLARFNHMNMIRVWGGGIYESDDFFDACDEMGILVWHDFAFACGDYPTHARFLDSIRQEAEQQVMRWRNRTCLALICGNNEDFMLADWTNVEYDFKDTTGPFLDKPTFPQREIYLRILPDVCERLCSSVPYWPSSPWGGKNASDPTVGDIHQWAVWHIDQKPYQSYKDISGRFVSEFGMHSFPVERTVNSTYFLPSHPDHVRHPQSAIVDCRNKGHGAETRLARYLAENFRYDNNNLSNWIYSTQLLQSEAYGYAYRDFKRKFAGKNKEACAGALVWQFNDVYPTTSWATTDYYIRPKPSFYTIRRACADISVACERHPGSRWINEDKPLTNRAPSFDIFAHNMTNTDKECALLLNAYDFHTKKWSPLDAEEQHVVLKAGYNTEIASISPQSTWSDESLIILQAILLDISTKKTLARFVSWPEPFRYLYWPKETKVNIAVESNSNGSSEWEDTVIVDSDHPIKGCWLQPVYDGKETLDDKEPLWEDNMFDLMPGEPIAVGVNGLRGRGVQARFLYDWECN